MPRLSRAVIPGVPHHITQRGNFRQVVFESDADRSLYLEWIAQYAAKSALDIWAYCLMSNHVHFIAVPHQSDSLARAFNPAHMRFSQHVNRRNRRTGHLWQGRFFSCALDEQHVYRAVRYVELNPVRAGVAAHVEDYPWSSARAHVLGERNDLLQDHNWFHQNTADWRAYLAEGENNEWTHSFRKASRAGIPLGSAEFIARMESQLGRKLEPRPRGRPKKEQPPI